ncbi:MAG TPA: hypothetical protein VIT62_12080 [Lysobacter sp.]
MKKAFLFLSLAGASAAASAAESNGIGYSYVQLDYIYNDSLYNDYKGPGLTGSIELGNGFFATGDYSSQKINHFGGHNDITEWSLGGGFAKALGANLDWVTQAAYVEKDAHLSVGAARVTEDVAGFRVSSGMRGRIAPKLIGHAYLGYQDLGNVSTGLGSARLDGDVYGDLGMEYQFTDRWAATGTVTLSEGITEYGTGLRLTF